MPNYFIPCTWEQTAFHVIEAESLEAAQEIALNGNDQGLEMLPPPHQELSNNEYSTSPDDIREATPEEVKRAQMPSYKEALRECLEALKQVHTNDTKRAETARKWKLADQMVFEAVQAAIAKAEKALAA